MKAIKLKKLKPGTLFHFDGTVGLKTEYINESGAIEAYIVGSGEMFWGGAKTVEDQHNLKVIPLKFT